MANPHRGEITLEVVGRVYTLRPTFHIVSVLEQRIGLSVEALAHRAHTQGLLAAEIMMILAIATNHDGSPDFVSKSVLDLPASEVNMKPLMPQIAAFLQEAVRAAPVDSRMNYLAWAHHSLAVNPATFWHLTPHELQALLPQKPMLPPAPEAGEVTDLMQRFPDMAATA